MITIQQTSHYRELVQQSLDRLLKRIGNIQIGSKRQFPFGWRKAAKGRTVWRILEEAVNQNLEVTFNGLGMSLMEPSSSEVSVYDNHVRFSGIDADIYLNIKSSVSGVRRNKDDISKAAGLREFFLEDIDRQLFICTFVLNFKDDMSIELQKCSVFPISWLPDIYVNPSNNGNLQSSKYKNLDAATPRTNEEFFIELEREIAVARRKREAKRARS